MSKYQKKILLNNKGEENFIQMFAERLKKLIKHLGISITSFESSIGVSKGAIAKPIKNNRSVGVEVLEKILYKYPQVSMDWLVSGKGTFSKSGEEPTMEKVTENNSDHYITITKDEFIELQRKALRQEDRIRELEKEVERLKGIN